MTSLATPTPGHYEFTDTDAGKLYIARNEGRTTFHLGEHLFPNTDAPAIALAILTAAGVTPDSITINRADLPEVRNDGSLILRSGSTSVHKNFESARMRSSALERLALAEFLEAREKAAEEADLKLCRRRDALASEIDKDATCYEGTCVVARHAIDMIIQLQEEATK